jgi:hypothetical protein
VKKICIKCKKNKPLEEYYKDYRTKGSRYSECKICYNIRQEKYRKSDKGKVSQAKKSAKYAKSDKGKATQARHRKTDKGKATQARAYAKHRKTDKGKISHTKANVKYLKTDKGKASVIRRSHARRAREKETLNNFDAKESRCILFLQNYKCIHPDCIDYFDEVEPTLDHIKPVIKGGNLIKENIQYLCRKHNSMKGVQTIDYRSQIHKQTITNLN